MKQIKTKTLVLIIGIVAGIIIGSIVAFGIMNSLDDGDKTSSKGDVFKTETLYCNLYYPTKWEEKVEIQETLNIVHFRTDFGDDKTLDLFDLVVTEVSDDEKNNDIEVHVVTYDLTFDDAWSNKEKKEAQAMQDDVSCVIDYLEKGNIAVVR